MKRILTMIMLLAILIPVPSASAQSSGTTCADFTYQEEAQRAFDEGEGQRSQAYMTGMDQDNDGIACEHLPSEPAFYQTVWFWLVVAVLIALAIAAFWWRGKVRAANARRNEPVLFPGRTASEEVEDDLALLKADRDLRNEE